MAKLQLILLFTMAAMAPAAARPDSASTDSVPGPWLYFDITGGAQYMGDEWTPYTTTLNVAASCLRRLNHSSLWIDASFNFGRGTDIEGDGLRYGPGTEFVQLQAGLGRVWSAYDSPFAFTVAGGLTYVWADMFLTETSGNPPARTVRTVDDGGNFFGGYARAEVMYQLGKEIYIGIGLLGKLTSNQDILGRNVNINSLGFGLSIGARN